MIPMTQYILAVWKAKISMVMAIMMTNIMMTVKIVKMRMITMTIPTSNEVPDPAEKYVFNQIILKLIH